MHRFLRLLLACLPLLLASAATAGDPSIAIYAGTEKISSIGGGNSPSLAGTATGSRRQPIYVAIDIDTGRVQRVVLKPRTKKFKVEPPVQLDQVFAETGGHRSKQHVRLMLLTRAEPQPGEFINTSIQYDGRVSDSTVDAAALTRPYPRVLTWSLQVQYSGFAVAPPGITYFPQIDTGRATLSLNKPLTRNAATRPLADAINLIRGALALRGFGEET